MATAHKRDLAGARARARIKEEEERVKMQRRINEKSCDLFESSFWNWIFLLNLE